MHEDLFEAGFRDRDIGKIFFTKKAQKLMDIDIRAERAKALYEEDEIMPQRKSHKNAQIDKLYKEFLGAPNGHLAHELLHTTYAKREIYPDSVLEE